MNFKALWIILYETLTIKKKKSIVKCLGASQKFYRRFMYIAPSSGEPLPNINWTCKWIVRRFEVVFWCLEWECCTLFKSTNTIFYYGFTLNSLGLMKLLWRRQILAYEGQEPIENKEKGLCIDLQLRRLFDFNASLASARLTVSIFWRTYH